MSAEQIIEELYIRCLTRKPSDDELARFQKYVEGTEEKQKVLEDLFWALLNSKEFIFNH